jgi:hypothetical protein
LMKKGGKKTAEDLVHRLHKQQRGHHSPWPRKQTNSTTDNQPMVTPTYQRLGKVSPIKNVKKKWREMCGNVKTVGQTMAMGVNSRRFWEVFRKFWAVLSRSTSRGIGVLNRK